MSAAAATVVELHLGQLEVGSHDPKRTTTPSAEQYAAFSRMYAYYNERLFEKPLPEVLLTFSRRQKARGFFWPERWHERADEQKQLGEIALNPDCLPDLDARTIVSIIVHEMVHCWQAAEGTPSRRAYHNKEWAGRMEQLGLMPSDTGQPGGAKTGQKVSHYVIEGGPFALAFAEMPAEWFLPFMPGSKPVTPKRREPLTVAYDCPACGISVKGRPGFHLQCVDCGAQMLAAGAPVAEPAAAVVASDPADPKEAQVHPATNPADTSEEVPVAKVATDADTEFDWAQLPWQDDAAGGDAGSATG